MCHDELLNLTMQDFLADFEQTLTGAVQRLNGISPEQANLARAPGKWTRKEILGHLIDRDYLRHMKHHLAQILEGL
jgi:hypothetical protein